MKSAERRLVLKSNMYEIHVKAPPIQRSDWTLVIETFRRMTQIQILFNCTSFFVKFALTGG